MPYSHFGCSGFRVVSTFKLEQLLGWCFQVWKGLSVCWKKKLAKAVQQNEDKIILLFKIEIPGFSALNFIVHS